MTNPIATTQAFQERMFARMRDSMGDLMTDEDLKTLLARAIEEAFFKPIETRNSYGSVVGTREPLLDMLRTELSGRVAKEVSAWCEANPDKIKEALDKVVANGIVGMVERWFESKTSWPIQQLALNVQQALSQPR